MGKMPPSVSPLSSEMVQKPAAVPQSQPPVTEQISLKTSSMPVQVTEKKKEQEAQKEDEKGKEIPSLEKKPPLISTDEKHEESKLKDKIIDPDDLGKKPKEEQLQEIKKPEVPAAKEKALDQVSLKEVHEEKQAKPKTEDSAPGIPQTLPKEEEKTQKRDARPQSTPSVKPDKVETVKEKTEKEEDKSDTSSSQQQKSPQGLSDTGYSSDGISGSLGEIPSLIPGDEKDLPQELKKDSHSQESSPTSPSDLAKLESTVLSILEAQVNSLVEEKSEKKKELYGGLSEQPRDEQKTKDFPVILESYSSEEEEEELKEVQEEKKDILVKGDKENIPSIKALREKADFVDDVMARRQRYDSLEDSSESENSPVSRRKRRTSIGSSSSDEYKQEDSQASGDDEDFIRKQIIEMSADEDVSGSDDDDFIRKQLKEISISESQKKEETKGKGKGLIGKHRRLTRKSSTSFDEDAGRRHSWHDEDDETFDESPELKYRETKSQESEELTVTGGGGLRRFKTIELNSTVTDKYPEDSVQKKASLYFDEEPELEMESLTDSPEDRSRGEGSSSLHASSFTPGTSPTSVSSLDEDSDSSPSHKKGESKQRKSRHRSHGPLLPTIEDSSEEEEMREEEELLKEQEKQRELEQQQRKSSSKKSKKDKDELRAQRRRERPKTPPSNLSPIEDASPTEELRQAAEMEELHRSSCSEYSPSIESDPEGFEISPEKIIEVQKVYKLPTAVSLYSPTDEQSIAIQKEGGQKVLKSAEEMYEEMMHKSHKSKAFPVSTEKDEVFEKEPLYGGMLIEDYIYESLVEDTYNVAVDSSLLTRQDEGSEFIQPGGRERKMRLPEETYEDPMQKISDLQKEFYELESLHSMVPQEDIVSSSFIIPESHEIVDLGTMVTSTSEEKQLLDADAAYEELMKRQQMQLTPGSSPTQPATEHDITEPTVDFDRMPDTSLTSSILSGASLTDSTSSATLSIPDVKITQHFSPEEIEDEYITDYTREIQEIIAHESSILAYSEPSESATSVPPSDTPSLTSSISSVCTTDSSSPITAPETTTAVFTDTVDQLAKFQDSEKIPSLPPFPVDTKVYSGIVVSLDQTAQPPPKTIVDHVAISLPDLPLSVTVPEEAKPKQSISDSFSVDSSVSEKEDTVRKTKSKNGNGVMLETYKDKSKAPVPSLRRISSVDSVSAQPPPSTTAVPVSDQMSTISSMSREVTDTVSQLPSLTSSVPAVTPRAPLLWRSYSLDSSAQPPPAPLPPPLLLPLLLLLHHLLHFPHQLLLNLLFILRRSL
ncbi:protein piccolo-like [Phascolarctos cinereus]